MSGPGGCPHSPVAWLCTMPPLFRFLFLAQKQQGMQQQQSSVPTKMNTTTPIMIATNLPTLKSENYQDLFTTYVSSKQRLERDRERI